MDGEQRSGRALERSSTRRRAAEGRDRDPLLRGDTDGFRGGEGGCRGLPRVPPAHHGFPGTLALPSGCRPCRRRVLAQTGAFRRHRGGATARPRARSGGRPSRRAAFRSGASGRRGAFTGRGSGNPRAMPAARRRPIRIGCSGWNYQSWRDEFYEGKPARLWLRHYAEHFDTVEVNTTFYRLPLRTSVARWVEETPQRFLFAVKASRYLTHIKRLTDLAGGIERYYERLEPLVATSKLGPVLWQLPANFRRDDHRLANALAALPPGRHCFEFR